MPKKPKFTKEQVINAAYELIKQEGIESFAARPLAKKLNSACSPIFTLFESMEDVKMEVYKKVRLKKILLWKLKNEVKIIEFRKISLARFFYRFGK